MGIDKIYRVPTQPGKPGKMRVHLENLEISWNFVKFNKYHGKMTCNLENFVATKKNSPRTPRFGSPIIQFMIIFPKIFLASLRSA